MFIDCKEEVGELKKAFTRCKLFFCERKLVAFETELFVYLKATLSEGV